MKTMIRRKLARKLFVGYSFLLMLPAAALNPRTSTLSPAFLPGTPALPLHDSLKRLAPDSTTTLAARRITLNKNVTGFVLAYLKREAEFLQKMKARSRRYFGSIEDILSNYALPLELKYLAIVESKLQPKAISPAGAGGLWQLMPRTAKELGLQVAGKADERLHAYRSTVAAAKYLRRLYAQFGDWLLVLAAYNSGPGTVYKAMKKAGSKNYWALQRFLPPESRGHVKRYIGVLYFFEGQGGETTQTKAEARAWQERVQKQITAKKEAETKVL
jgi:membrane-bound lytic murein transglycosylase D